MLRYEDADTLTNPTRALLSAHGYTESERDAYSHWKDISYTNGDTTFTFTYSRHAGNLKTVYVSSETELWRCHVDLHTNAMNFNGYLAKYLPGTTFTEKLHALIASPTVYCIAADTDRDKDLEDLAQALDRAAAPYVR